MDIETRETGGVSLCSLGGKLDTTTCVQLDQHLGQVIEQGTSKIIIDCTNLDFISSAGLRVLLSCTKRLAKEGGGLRIFGMNETVKDIFEISGFNVIFNVFESEEEALGGF
jgi:anti-anti-sigma factor